MIYYVASKTKHAWLWRKLRSEGISINSTWIDEAESGQTNDRSELAMRCLKEVSECDCVLAMVAEGDVMKGALIEIGVALHLLKPVKMVSVGRDFGVFQCHPLWFTFKSIEEALSSDIIPESSKEEEKL